MRASVVFMLLCALAASAPLWSYDPQDTHVEFAGWPTHWEGRSLTPLPLTLLEKRFAQDFPGGIARFSDGEQEIILRYITTPTRKLHPAADCFVATGYAISAQRIYVDGAGHRWSQFHATHQTKLQVRERIFDESGNQYTDVSAWYWAAVRGNTAPPWWAVTVAERVVSQ